MLKVNNHPGNADQSHSEMAIIKKTRDNKY